MTIKDLDNFKTFKSADYNFIFNKKDGTFMRWGATVNDDPEYAPSPEILDIEISTICNGIDKPCAFCYKSNTAKGKNMSLDTFKLLFAKICPIEIIEVESNNKKYELKPDQVINTKRGKIKAKDLIETDELLLT
jgi:hypothetical protein